MLSIIVWALLLIVTLNIIVMHKKGLLYSNSYPSKNVNYNWIYLRESHNYFNKPLFKEKEAISCFVFFPLLYRTVMFLPVTPLINMYRNPVVMLNCHN